MKKIRIGIIGAGGIAAKLHLPELAEETARAEVALVSGRTESRLRHLCDHFGALKFTHKYDDVIEDDKIDAVIVATPHPQHVSWGIKALAAGKHLYMQKPLCADMAEADSFVAAVEKTNRTVFCLPHFVDIFHSIKQNMAKGAIGKISGGRARTSHGGPEVYYREVWQIFGEKEDQDLWFFDSKRAEVGALFDMGVYAVAHMVALLGTVKRVTAMTGTLDKPTDLEDTATLVMQMESGAIATAETGWCDPGRTWQFDVHGTAGKYEIPGKDGAAATQFIPTAYDSDAAPIRQLPVEPTVRVGSSHKHFLDCIEKSVHPPLSHAWAARHVVEILLAGLESARTGRAVDLRSSAEPRMAKRT